MESCRCMWKKMAINDSMYSSEKHDWETPADFFEGLNRRYKFQIDLAANSKNAKLDTYYSEKDDALSKDWNLTSWLNPPYGRAIGNWIQRAHLQSKLHFSTIVVLMPARTDTLYFHDYVMKAKKIFFVRGRLTFVGAPSPAPFPSMVVEFSGKDMPYYLSPDIYTMDRKGNVIYGNT